MIDSQRAERVVVLYFCVRIRVRGGAKRASLLAKRSHPKQRNILSIFCRLLPAPLLRKYEGKDISLFLDRRSESTKLQNPTNSVLLRYKDFTLYIILHVSKYTNKL